MSLLLLPLAPVLAAVSLPWTQSCSNEGASLSDAGVFGNRAARRPSISRDGLCVLFDSDADDLVPGDTNGERDAFVRDRRARHTECVSRSHDGAAANGDSFADGISGDGRFVVFSSDATNLVPADSNGRRDVFLRDRQSGAIERISVSTAGVQGDALSSGGSVSADGRFVAFTSDATKLAGDDVYGWSHVYLRDRVLATTTLVTRSPAGLAGDSGSGTCAISSDGGFIVFVSGASNLVFPPIFNPPGSQVFVFDRSTAAITLESVTPAGVRANAACDSPTISDSGRFIAFASSASDLVLGDTNGQADVFVRERASGLTTLASLGPGGLQGNLASSEPRIAALGAHVVFTSLANNLVPADTNARKDVFLRDLAAGATRRVSLNFACNQLPEDSRAAAASGDGRVIAFESSANNVVAEDFNADDDVFATDSDPDSGSYCSGKISSIGCLPSISMVGIPSAGTPSEFWIDATQLPNHRTGLVYYGHSGPQATPYAGGVMCVAAPRRRTGVQSSGGTPSPALDCTGAHHLDFGAWIASGVDPALTIGQQVWAQYRGRDPGYSPPYSVSLSNAVTLTIQL